jgi:hypothetical protein
VLKTAISLWGGVTTPVSDFDQRHPPRFVTDGGPIDMALALTLGRGPRGAVWVKVRLVSADGHEVDPDGFETVWGGMPVTLGVVVPTRGLETRVMLDASGLLLPGGAYRWELELDGQAVETCPFEVQVIG